MSQALSLTELAARSVGLFKEKYGRAPTIMVAAPGRVNLIGEHTDYNDGFVLPMAIDRYTVIAADKGSTDATVFSSTVNESQVIPLIATDRSHLPEWSRYVACVLDQCAGGELTAPAFDAVIDSNVPLGGGLSSSAALEVATATLVEELGGKKLDAIQKALVCQQAEHEVGVPCGIMDQFSSVLCQAGHLMLLDCRSQEPKMVPFADSNLKVLIINTNVKHELTGGEYAERRAQCEAAAATLGVLSLREADTALLEEKKAKLDDVHYRRARHVIGEIERTTAAAAACQCSDWHEFGALMYQSHAALRDDYEVSCPELDVLVEEADKIGTQGGVYGARMTGGGFGGCTVSLVRADHVNAIAEKICGAYLQRTGIEATAFATPPAQGAMVLTDQI